MANSRPPELARLLDSPASTRDIAWESFLAVHHRLLLHVARSFAREHDAAMDAFAWVLDRLRENDCRRLRAFAADGRSEFSTWLVVVVRRLCLDWYRSKYGRERSAGVSAHDNRSTRRRLVDLATEGVDTSELPQLGGARPDAELRAAELALALQAALAELEPSDRLILKLRFDDGLSGGEIADFMRLPTPFHAYRRITNVLESLRRALKARGVEGPIP